MTFQSIRYRFCFSFFVYYSHVYKHIETEKRQIHTERETEWSWIYFAKTRTALAIAMFKPVNILLKPCTINPNNVYTLNAHFEVATAYLLWENAMNFWQTKITPNLNMYIYKKKNNGVLLLLSFLCRDFYTWFLFHFSFFSLKCQLSFLFSHFVSFIVWSDLNADTEIHDKRKEIIIFQKVFATIWCEWVCIFFAVVVVVCAIFMSRYFVPLSIARNTL